MQRENRKGTPEGGVAIMRISLDIGESEFEPMDFVHGSRAAEEAGFERIWLGDHLMPWVDTKGRSAFAWSVLSVCLERTKGMQIAPYVTTPIGGRYHPALVAQMIATIDNMYPGRCPLAVGTGEGVNEANFFKRWPDWKERSERLVEGLALIRELLAKDEFIDFDGKYFPMKKMRLYTRPKTKIPVYFSAIGEKSAYLSGRHADHLITLARIAGIDGLEKKVLPAFAKGQRDAGKDPEKAKKVATINYSFLDEKEYLKQAKRMAGLLSKHAWVEPDPREIEQMGKDADEKRMLSSVHLCKDWDGLAEVIEMYSKKGITEVVLFTGPEPKRINEVATQLLPHFS
jgi:coenzyme F420-dependent glucose-6-phosphate dehydrogenase